MRKGTFRFAFCLALMAGVALPMSVTAAIIAEDDAGNTEYDSGWANASNGGSGLGAWVITTGGSSFAFMGDAASNGGGSAINTSNRAWGMAADTGETTSAVRPFGSALQVGDVISVEMDNGAITSGATGLGLQNGSGENLCEVFFGSGNTNYTISDDAGNSDSGVASTQDGIRVTWTLVSATTYNLRIEVLDTGGGVASTTDFNGRTLLNPTGGQSVDQLRLWNFDGGFGGKDTLFNNIVVDRSPTAVTGWSIYR